MAGGSSFGHLQSLIRGWSNRGNLVTISKHATGRKPPRRQPEPMRQEHRCWRDPGGARPNVINVTSQDSADLEESVPLALR